MSERKSVAPGTRILPLSCFLLTAILLVIALWPFDPFPRNEVTWLPGHGVEFGDHGIIFSPGFLEPGASRTKAFCSLAIRLQPRVAYLNNSGTLLVFYTPEDPSQFRLMQYRDELLIRRDRRDDKNHLKTIEIELEHVFLRDEPVSFTITSGPDGSVAYRNGVWAGASKRMGLSCVGFSGQLILGNSAVSDNPWLGKLFDVAIYDRGLTPEEVARDYAMSTSSPAQQESASNRGMIARYSFTGGPGKTIQSATGSAPALFIPEVFRILHKKILMMPWEESPDKLDLRDIVINIVGLVPFGFLLFTYLGEQLHWKRAALLTVLAGAALSFTIEVLQGFIPSRDSGVLDIITNSFGTYLGVLLFRWPPVQAVAKKLFALPQVSAGHL
jgi:VanZ family protein